MRRRAPSADPRQARGAPGPRREPQGDVRPAPAPPIPKTCTRLPFAPTIRIEVEGILPFRDVVIRAVSSACKLVTPHPEGGAWTEFHVQVISAVGEAFNHIVRQRRPESAGEIQVEVQIDPNHITIAMSDCGTSFAVQNVEPPDLDSLPEDGLDLFIIQSFMDLAYHPGRPPGHPNVLTLSKTLDDPVAA